MIGTPGVNLHAPGPIGDVTPATLSGTTLTLNNDIPFTINTPDFAYTVVSGGNNTWSVRFGASGNDNGVDILFNGVQVHGGSGSYGFAGSTPPASAEPRYSAEKIAIGNPSTGTGSLMFFDTAWHDAVKWNASTLTFSASYFLTFGVAGTGSLTPGAFAATTNATMVIGKDSSGKVITVPCTLT